MYINGQPIFAAETKNKNFIKSWREYQHSLTDKLRAAKGDAQVHVISQNWIKPTWWDKYLLKINDELIIQREILMKYQEIDYWYARTVIPQKCYNLNPVFFNRLAKESIRNLIFDDNQVQRTNMISYPIDNQCIEFSWAKKHLKTIQELLWVRLAEYTFQRLESFFVVEILFPELENVL